MKEKRATECSEVAFGRSDRLVAVGRCQSTHEEKENRAHLSPRGASASHPRSRHPIRPSHPLTGSAKGQRRGIPVIPNPTLAESRVIQIRSDDVGLQGAKGSNRSRARLSPRTKVEVEDLATCDLLSILASPIFDFGSVTLGCLGGEQERRLRLRIWAKGRSSRREQGPTERPPSLFSRPDATRR